MSTSGPQPISPADAAIAAVFGTAELFEAILLQADMLDVFRAQRVCKLWQSSTQGSKRLQRKMFVLQDGSPVSPMLTQASWSFYLNRDRDRDRLTPDTADIVHQACDIRLNPATKALGWGGKQPWQHNGYQGSEHPTKRSHFFGHKDRSLAHMHAHFIEHTTDQQVHYLLIIRMQLLTQRLQRIWPATKDQHASWREMFVTQPPFTTMELEARSKSSERFFSIRRMPDPIKCTAYNPNGLTFGDLDEVLSKLGDSSHEKPYSTYVERLCQGSITFEFASAAEDMFAKGWNCSGMVGFDQICDCVRMLREEKVPACCHVC